MVFKNHCKILNVKLWKIINLFLFLIEFNIKINFICICQNNKICIMQTSVEKKEKKYKQESKRNKQNSNLFSQNKA